MRPARCLRCDAAAHPVGEAMVVVGHGVVRRTVLGPLEVTGPPEERVLALRRYRCRACRHVMTVGPRGLSPRRLFSAAAIALGLALYAAGCTTKQLRERLSPRRLAGPSATDEWLAPKRWVLALAGGLVFAGLGAVTAPEPRRRAELAVLALSARAPNRTAPLEELVFRAAS